MSWDNFDWLDFELGDYQDSLHHRVHEAYNAAYRVLEEAYQTAKKKLEEDLKKSKDEEEFSLDSQIIDYEDHRWIEQHEALATMALALLASLTKSFLDEQKGRNLNKTHPPDKKGYGGGSELQRRVTEYKARFGVDLEQIECFETVREVELARNCCLHREGAPNDDYLNKTQRRLLNDSNRLLDLIFKLLFFKPGTIASLETLDNGSVDEKGVGQCRSPLIGRGRARHDIAAASLSFSPFLPSSSSAVGPRCRITSTCSGSSRSATGTCSGKHWASSGGSSRLLQRPHFSFCTDRS